jgi:uncharacterized protein (DUF2141 family)
MPAGTLHVTVQNIEDNEGDVLLACFDGAEAWMQTDQILIGERAPCPRDGQDVQFMIRELPEGRYACCVLVDLNQNQKMDLNLVGYPTEAHGFSNEATGRMGPPSFEEAAFNHRGETRITISVR